VVPANSFAEYAPEPNPETKKKDVVWFALSEERPLFAFAGIWTTFNGDRGTKSSQSLDRIRCTAFSRPRRTRS
jgi:putative SOS response-associated peptidase YedK